MAGPAGRGKSALLAHWIQDVEERNQKSDKERRWHLVFVPISIRFGTNQPRVFYEALAARLASIVGAEIDVPRTDAEVHYEDQCRLMLGQASSSNLRILIVIDGADEALGGRFNVSWFPKVAAETARLLVSARLQAGDRDARGWVQRLGWSHAIRVQTLDLPPLDQSHIRSLLNESGAPVDVLAVRPDVVRQLAKLTGGEPLLLRFYVEDLWTRGEEARRLTLDDLANIKPGLGGYFSDWMIRQREAWGTERGEGAQIDERILYAYLAVLACAYGRLSADELSEIAQRSHGIEPSLRTEDALGPIRRFVIGAGSSSGKDTEGFVLSHPKLGEFLREDYLNSRVIKQTRVAFASWCQESLRSLNSGELPPAAVPVYALQYLSSHLEDVSATASEFMAMVEVGWLRAWQTFEGGYLGFSQDVRRATNLVGSSSEEIQVRRAWQMRCHLVLSSAASAIANVPRRLMADCVKYKLLPPRQALLWIQHQPVHDRIYMLSVLVRLLPEDLIPEAMRVAKGINDPSSRARALALFVPVLTGPNRTALLAEALEAADQAPTAWPRAEVLSIVASVLSPADQTIALRQLVDVIPATIHFRTKESDTAQVYEIISSSLTLLLSAFADDERDLALRPLLDLARAMEDGQNQIRCLLAIAPSLSSTARGCVLSETLRIASELSSPWKRARSLMAVAQALPDPRRQAVADEGIDAIGAIDEPLDRAELVAELAHLIPASCVEVEGRSSTAIEEALATAYAINNSSDCARLLGALAGALPAPKRGPKLARALAAARSLSEQKSRASVLGSLIPGLPERDQRTVLVEALSLGSAIGDGLSLANALIHVASMVGGDERSYALSILRSIVNTIDSNYQKSSILVKVARLVTGDERASVIGEALAAAHSVDSDYLLGLVYGELASVLVDADANLGPEMSHVMGVMSGNLPPIARLSKSTEPAAAAPRGNAASIAPLEHFVEASRAIQAPQHRAYALARLLPRMQALGRIAIFEDAIKALGQYSWHHEGAPTSTLVMLGESIKLLPESERAPYCCKLLWLTEGNALTSSWALGDIIGSVASNLENFVLNDDLEYEERLRACPTISDDKHYLEAFVEAASLTRLLPLDKSAPLLRVISTQVSLVYTPNRRAILFAALAALVITGNGVEGAEAIYSGLAAARMIEDAECRALALAALAPSLRPTDRATAYDDSKLAAEWIQDPGLHEQTSEIIAWSLGQSQKQRADIDDLASGLPRHEGMTKVLDFGPRVLGRSGRLKIHSDPGLEISTAEHYHSSDFRMHDRLIWKALMPALFPAIHWESDASSYDELIFCQGVANDFAARARLLVKLVPVNQLAWQAAAVTEAAVAMVRLPGGASQARMINILRPVLAPELLAGVIGRALADARSRPAGITRVRAMADLASGLVGQARAKLLSDALAEARGADNALNRVNAMVPLVPLLSEKDRTVVLNELLATVPNLLSVRAQVYALVALAPVLPDSRKETVLKVVLAAASRLDDAHERGNALAELTPVLPRQLQVVALDHFLERAGDISRPLLLAILPNFLSVLDLVEGASGTREILKSVRDIASWFP